MSADNVRGWEIVRKMNIWPRSEASRANVKFWGQSLSQGHYQRINICVYSATRHNIQGYYQPTYQQARKGFIYFITLNRKVKPLVNMVKKPVVIWWRRCVIDVWEKTKVNLIGLTNIISTVIGPNLTSCHVKLILVTPLGSKTRKLGAFCLYSPTYCSKTWLEINVLVSEFTSVKHIMCKIWSTWRWTDFSSFSRLRWSTSAGLSLFWAEGHRVSSRVGYGCRASFAGGFLWRYPEKSLFS